MPLNKSKIVRVQLAASQFAQKVKLERKFKTELNVYFAQIAKDFKVLYPRTGSIPNTDIYLDDLKGILSRNYRRVSRAFQGSLISFLKKNQKNLKEPVISNLSVIAQARGIALSQLVDSIEESVLLQVNEFINTSVDKDSRFINNTNIKELQKVLDVAINDLTGPGKIVSRKKVALEASKNFSVRARSRASTISLTGVQKVSELTKNSEFGNFISVRNSERDLVPPMDEEPIWVTMGDKKVRRGRFSHVEADSQRRQNGVFTVGGELLRFPGDTSLGASIGNVANCRCAAIPTIDDKPVAEL